MSSQSVIEALRRCVLFRSYREPELRILAESARTLKYEAGDVVCRQGEEGDSLLIIVSGSVRVTQATEKGLEQAIALLGPGACFGEMALLDAGTRSATATATRPSTLVRVGLETLDAVSRRHPEARIKFLEQGVRMLSGRLRSANQRYWDLANRSVQTRMNVSESRSRLLSLVSHELRTPLTVIKASAQLITRGAEGQETAFADKIVRETGHLQVLIEDLIALCLLQSGAGAGDATELDAAGLVAEVVKELSSLAERSGVGVTVRPSEASSTILADKGLLRRALRHLVENAIKFSPVGGDVRIEIDAGPPGRARIRIIDQGRGIDAASLERLRQSFVQDQSPLNRDVEGLGIGLPLAYEVVAALGGSLSADSAEGRGTQFILDLPRVEETLAFTPAEERSMQHG